MLRRSFRAGTVNAASAVCLVLVVSGACARATQDDAEPKPQGGQSMGQPTGSIGSQTGGTFNASGGVTAPSGGTAQSTGGVPATGGKASGGTTGSGGKAAGGSNSSGGGPTGGKATTTGGSANEGGEFSGGAGGGGTSAMGGSAGGDSGGTGGTKATGGSAGITGNSADCDFGVPECADLSCAEACPTNMGTYCADSCEAVIECIEDNPTCGTAVDPMCVRRNGGTAAKCTGVWESASGAQTPIGLPAQTAINFFNCACGGGVPPDSGGGGEAGAGS